MVLIRKWENEFNESYRMENFVFKGEQVNYKILGQHDIEKEFGKFQAMANFWIDKFVFDKSKFTVPSFKDKKAHKFYIYMCVEQDSYKEGTVEDFMKDFAFWMFSYLYYKIKRDLDMDLELKNILQKKKISIKSIVKSICLDFNVIVYTGDYLKYIPKIIRIAMDRRTDNFLIEDMDNNVLPIDINKNDTIKFRYSSIDDLVDNEEGKVVFRAFFEDPVDIINDFIALGIIPIDLMDINTPYGKYAMIQNSYVNYPGEDEVLLEHGYLNSDELINTFFWWMNTILFRKKLLLYEKDCAESDKEVDLNEEINMGDEYFNFAEEYTRPSTVNIGNVDPNDPCTELKEKAQLLLKYIAYTSDVNLEYKKDPGIDDKDTFDSYMQSLRDKGFHLK